MCGIIGIISQHDVAQDLIKGLKHIEYRGYDSAGLVVTNMGSFHRHRAEGKISNLVGKMDAQPLSGPIGIAHTRWASHGAPSEANAHPHWGRHVAMVHNGIIENHDVLRQKLLDKGVVFTSETDSESVVLWVDHLMEEGLPPLEAVQKTLPLLKGAYAFVFLFKDYPDLLIGARHACPLVVGYGSHEMYFGSDALALSHKTRRVTYLKDGDLAVLTRSGCTVYDSQGQTTLRGIVTLDPTDQSISKMGYPHFMLKEIHEQPDCVRATFSTYIAADRRAVALPKLSFSWKDVSRLNMVACGTAFYAGLVARHWFEDLARLPVDIDIASEFRYRQPPLCDKGVSLFISQSGETADTLAAHAYAQEQGQKTIGIVNVPHSSLARHVTSCILTHAGPEIGVASTKAFTTQLMVLAILALDAAHQRGHMDHDTFQAALNDLSQVPALMAQTLSLAPTFKTIAHGIQHASDTLFLGRGLCHGLALEGALKLKELSYIHAEGYAAGELKHGPIALIDNKMPVIVLAPGSHELFQKTASNIEETLARHGVVTVLTDAKGRDYFRSTKAFCVEMPKVTSMSLPFVYSLPMQMIAYYTAVLRDTDVDQPRNLAKSVTIE